MTLADLNAMDQAAFVKAVGWVFEHSPFVAERAWLGRPFRTTDDLHARMVDEVESAHPAEQLSLLHAHPDLGARVVMSEASEAEQAGAGLDQLTPVEFERLYALNGQYRTRFGFPFIYAVKGGTKHDILQALERRLTASVDAERREALQQVYRIARFRLDERVECP